MARPGAGLDPRQHVGPAERLVLLPEAAAAVPHQRSASCAGARAGCRGRSPATSSTAEPGGRPMRGFPGRELALDPAAAASSGSTRASSARRPTGCASGCGGCCPPPPATTATSSTPAAGPGVFSLELAKRHPEAAGARRGQRPGRSSPGPTRSRARAGLTNCRFEQGDVTQLDFDGAVRPRRQRRQPRTRRGRRQRHAGAAGAAAARAAARRPRPRLRAALVRLRAPGELRRARPRPSRLPGRRARRQAARPPGSRSTAHQSTYGLLETFTNNISYIISGADQRRKVPLRRWPSRCSSRVS